MRFQVGQKVGDYEFLAVEETTPTGVTYRVHNALADRDELLKVLPRDLQEDSEGVERFLREAKIHARLHHPNIASFYTAARIEDQLVMTSELVEGKSLGQYISSGAITLERAAKYFEQALRALSYAHSEGVVHRDLTPNHLIITANDTVKVTGFGLAKKASDPQLTQPGIVMGSVHYMSPEQVKGSTELDRRSDIYSLGVVLYEAVTGKKPFDSKSQFEVFLAHVNQDPAPPSKIRPEIPAQLDQVVLTAMAKQPASRFQTAEEFRESLSQFRDSLGQLQSTLGTSREEPDVAEPQPELPKAVAPESGQPMSAPAGEQAPQFAAPLLVAPLTPVGDPVVAPSLSSETAERAAHEPIPPAAEQQPRMPAQLPGWEEPPISRDFALSDRGSSWSPTRQQEPSPALAGQDLHMPVSAPNPLVRPAASPAQESWQPGNAWPDADDQQLKTVPILLRSSDEVSAHWQASAHVPAVEPISPAESWFGEQSFAGWTSKDILAVGALTFVIVAAVFFTMLTFLNR